MRRSILLLFVLCPVFAQTSETDHAVLQKLTTEIQQLRLAIERSTLLSARTQLVMQELQVQEGRAATLSRNLEETRGTNAVNKSDKTRLTERIKQAEAKRTSPEFSTPQQREDLENMIQQLKLELDQRTAAELRTSAREAELTSEFMAAQRAVQDSQARISAMTQAIDNALQQMLKGQ